MAQAAVVQFKGVTKVFGNPGEPDSQLVALQPATFTINQGEFVAITGPSGSGKSTLLYLIGLLDRPTAGEVLIDGLNTSRMTDNDLAHLRNRKLGFVFQQFNLLARTAAVKNVELPLVYTKMSEADRSRLATEMLEKVGLGDRLHHKPSQLSGGQQQRVAIARALVTNPALLLADEPTGNLDSTSGRDILDLFKQLHKSGATIVLVTHDADIARQAQRRLVIKDGQIMKD